MMHRKKRWILSSIPTAEELARMLTESTWILCSTFFVEGQPDYLFLNDSTHEDGAGEWAILRRLAHDRFQQIESITFSWGDESPASPTSGRTYAGEFDSAECAIEVTPFIETPWEHGKCHLCA